MLSEKARRPSASEALVSTTAFMNRVSIVACGLDAAGCRRGPREATVSAGPIYARSAMFEVYISVGDQSMEKSLLVKDGDEYLTSTRANVPTGRILCSSCAYMLSI